jgi:lipopolysaccharide transport system ATP-binding protein
MNGAILGMSKKEIKSKFEEIVDFSGVEAFINTPVKRYSSGMYVRLAFAIAAHLEPEILIVDEVLAVGDIDFQEKCIGKMNDVSRQGRTVLLVSHNMTSIEKLCKRCINLESGRIERDGFVLDVVKAYRQSIGLSSFDLTTGVENEVTRRGNGNVRFSSLKVLDEQKIERWDFQSGEKITFQVTFEVLKEITNLDMSILLLTEKREILLSMDHTISTTFMEKGIVRTVEIEFNSINIVKGCYPLQFWLGASQGRPFDIVDGLTRPLFISGLERFGFLEDKSSLISMK